MSGKLARRLLTLTSLVLFMSWGAKAQNYSAEDLKVALVGQFIKNIEWPPGAVSDDFVIVVLKDRPIMSALSQLEGQIINDHRIAVRFAADATAIPKANLLYLSQNVRGDANSLLGVLRGSGTLIVTENSPTQYNIMIDITSSEASNADSRRLAFQINRPNLVFENLQIKPDLILYGGTELDVASLYRETEKAMQRLRSDNDQARQELDQKLQELSAQQARLTSLEQDFANLTQRLASNQGLLEQRQSLLDKQQRELAQSTERLGEVNQAYQDALREAEAQKLQAQTQRRDAEANIREQMDILESLKAQVGQQNDMLLEQEAALASTSLQLDAKSSEVQQQAEVIDKQYVIILTSIFSLIVFFVSTAVITKMFFKNRAINRELADALATLKNAQEQLIESEKLASLGEMVAGVAHEINTPIGILVTSSSTIGEDAGTFLKRLEDNAITKSEMRRFLTDLVDTDRLIQSNLDRCSNLIQNFKQISADQVVAEDRDIYLKDYLRNLMNTLSVFMQRNHVEWTLSGDNPPLRLDPGLLGQVINNLVNNAIHHAFVGRHYYTLAVNVTTTGRYAEIEFRDNGRGMDEETRKKIFEPFFTTKRGRGGVGLGMNIVYNLVTSKLNGTIAVQSEQEKGTTVTIKLPLKASEETSQGS